MAVTTPDYLLEITSLDGVSMGAARYFDNLSGPIAKLNGTPTLSFRLSGTDPLYGFVRSDNAGFCKLWRQLEGTSELLFHGQMVGRNEVGDASGVGISSTFAGPSFRLGHARASQTFAMNGAAGTFPTGAIDGALGAGIVLSREKTLNRITQQLRYRAASSVVPFTVPGAGVFGPTATGGAPGAGGIGGNVEIDMTGYEYLSDLWTDVAGGVGGLDWYVAPEEWTNYDMTVSGSTLKAGRIGMLVLGTIIGTTQDDVVFQYGGPGGNLEGFELQTSWETRATKVYGRLQNDTEVAATGLTNPIGGGMDAWVPVSDLNASLAADLVTEHASVRKYPRKIYTCTPTFEAPKFKVDYDLGDTVETRVTVGDNPLLGGGVRIHGVDIAQNGDTIVEKPVLIAES